VNSSADKDSWCSQIYNLWTEKEQKLSSQRYLILKRLPYSWETCTCWEQKWKRFLSHFHSCVVPWRIWRLMRSHIRRTRNYNSKRISIIHSDNTRRNPAVDQILEEPSFCAYFFHHISNSVYLWHTCCCRIRNTQRTVSNSEAKSTDNSFKKAFLKATKSNF